MSFWEFIMVNIDWITLLGIIGMIITGIATIVKTNKDNKNSVEILQEEHKKITDLLDENGKLRKNVDKILEMKKMKKV